MFTNFLLPSAKLLMMLEFQIFVAVAWSIRKSDENVYFILFYWFQASQDKKSLDVGANLFVGNLDPVRTWMFSNPLPY